MTPNDSRGHTGPNNYQNFPVLTSVVGSGATTAFAGTLKAMPPEIIWFFAAWFMPAGEMADCVLRFTSNRHR